MAFARYYYDHTAEGRHGIRRMYALGLILFIAFVGSEFQNPGHGIGQPVQFAMYVGGGLLVLGVLFAGYLRVVRPLVISAMSRGAAFQELMGVTTLTFDAKRVMVENEQGRTITAWDEVDALAETDTHIFLITGPLRAFIIPKRAFANEKEAAQCFERLLDCVSV